MSEIQSNDSYLHEAAIYEIRIKGHLHKRRTALLEGLTATCEPDGTTLLCGSLPDQTALHSILLRIRDMNLKLISVRQISNNAEGNFKTNAK